MSITISLIVLLAAFLHAFWNAVVKGAADKTIMLGLITLGHVVPGLVILTLVPPPGWVVWPYLVVSTIIHGAYFYLLNTAYRFGDLSIMYPIARGLAPVLVAVGAQVWIGESLPALAWAGVLCVSIGIMVLTRGVLSGALPMNGLIAAMGTAVMIAAYTLVDGVGIRLSDTALGYIGWLFAGEIFVAMFIFTGRMDRLRALPAKTIWLGIVGGLVSGAAYGLVLYAKTQAPLGVVSALRETSVIFAAMIGVLWFGEGPRRNRLIAAVIVAAGIILIGLA